MNQQGLLRDRRAEFRCADCGNIRPAGVQLHRGNRVSVYCRVCGNTEGAPSRDGVPYGVWLTLVDNEDDQGRVPADTEWNPH